MRVLVDIFSNENDPSAAIISSGIKRAQLTTSRLTLHGWAMGVGSARAADRSADGCVFDMLIVICTSGLPGSVSGS